MQLFFPDVEICKTVLYRLCHARQYGSELVSASERRCRKANSSCELKQDHVTSSIWMLRPALLVTPSEAEGGDIV
jgi:hypothetical protein